LKVVELWMPIHFALRNPVVRLARKTVIPYGRRKRNVDAIEGEGPPVWTKRMDHFLRATAQAKVSRHSIADRNVQSILRQRVRDLVHKFMMNM